MTAAVAPVLKAAAARLRGAGVDEPRLDALILLAQVLGVSTDDLRFNENRSLSQAEAAAYAALIDRRAAREPVSHLLGRREFWSLDFSVSRDVLDPRPDSETLIEAVLDLVPDRTAPRRILDLGTGSGCLLLTLLHELPQATGLGIDVSPAALMMAGANAAALNLSDRVQLSVGDWGREVDERFDIIVSNPPYICRADIAGLMPEVALYEPLLALDGGSDGLDAYRALAVDLPRLIRPDGLVALEIGAVQAAAVTLILRAQGLVVAPPRHDLSGQDRCLLASPFAAALSTKKRGWKSDAGAIGSEGD